MQKFSFQKESNFIGRINKLPNIYQVFFMLATNFSEKKEISFKLKQNIETFNDDQENLIIYIKNNSFVINEDSISSSKIEEEVLNNWNSKNYENIIILNDENSNLQKLIFILDILKKNQIKKVSFADDPKV